MGRIISDPQLHYAASEGRKFSADTTLRAVQCFTCGITYAIPESLYQSACSYHGDTPSGWKLACPLGHVWWFTGETDEDKLRRKLQAQRDRAGRLASERDQAKASAAAHKGVATRLKNRAHAGLCPHCNRHFKDLERHVKGQHPEAEK